MCRVANSSKAVRVGAWLACGRAREPEPPRLVQLAAGLQPQAGSSCLIHGSRPFVPHPNLYIPRLPPIRWQMVPRLHSPHPIDASKKTAARRAHTDDGKHVVARARGSGGRRNVAEWGGVCALREARGIAFLLTPFSTAGRNRTDGLIWPFGNLRMIMMDGIVKKRLGRSSGGRAVEQASKKRGVWGIWMGQGI